MPKPETKAQPAADDLVIEGWLMPETERGEGFWTARSPAASGTRLGGWSRVIGNGDRPSSEGASAAVRFSTADREPPSISALRLAAAAFRVALGSLPRSSRIAIDGRGTPGELIAWSLRRESLAIGEGRDGPVDVLIGSAGLPLPQALKKVAGEGRVIVLVAPWTEPVDVNLYPEVHWRSLTLLFRRWHRLPAAMEVAPADAALRTLAAAMGAAQRGAVQGDAAWRWRAATGTP